jgi:hypothetical protein
MIRSPERPILILLIAAALVTTGSYIGMAIMGMYGIYMFLVWGFSFLPTRYTPLSLHSATKASLSQQSPPFVILTKEGSASGKMRQIPPLHPRVASLHPSDEFTFSE